MKLEINYKEKNQKRTNTCSLSKMLLKIEWDNVEIKEEIRKYLKTKDSENTILQNLWIAANEVLKRRFIAIQGTQGKS